MEFMYVDQDDAQVRVLLPSVFPQGQAITLDGHEVKLVEVNAKSASTGKAIEKFKLPGKN